MSGQDKRKREEVSVNQEPDEESICMRNGKTGANGR